MNRVDSMRFFFSVNCEQVRVPEGSARFSELRAGARARGERECMEILTRRALHHQCRPPSEAESTPAEEEKRARLRHVAKQQRRAMETLAVQAEKKKLSGSESITNCNVNCYLCQ